MQILVELFGGKVMRKFLVLLVLSLLALTVSVTSAAAPTTAYLVHGIPGLPVDVYLDGKLTIPNFQPGQILGPLTGPAGSVDVAIVPAGGDPAHPALAGRFTFVPGGNVSVVAHLDANGAPTVSVFNNDFSATSGARVIVRHTAAAPAVDVVLLTNGAISARVGPASNGQQAAVDFAPGRYTGGLVPTGTDTLVYGPFSADLRGGYVYVVYAIGDIGAGSFQLISQTVKAG